MDGISATTLFYGSATALLLLIGYRKLQRSRRLPRPPGPPGYPIIGNILDAPTQRVWLGYRELAEKYGDMVYLEIFRQPILILSSLKRVNDLFEKRSNIYSDRIQPTMLIELMDLGHYMSVMPYGNWLKRHQKVFRQQIEPNDVSKWHPIMKKQVLEFLKAVQAEPEEWSDHVKHLFSSMMVEVTYGVKTTSLKDPFIKDMVESSLGFGQAAVPGRFLVDTFPFLKYVPSWFPGAGFQRFAAYYRAVDNRARNVPFDRVVAAMKAGSAKRCMVTSLVEALPDERDPNRAEEEQIARNVAAITHAAGSDTTKSVAMAFFNFAALNPEIQRKAQEELDRVVGYGRLPEFSDKESLVYVRAIVKEVARMHQAAPLALPHLSSADDVYEGYFIPKGTLVIGNAWYILHDPERFEDPFAFKPERYIKDGKIDPTVVDAYAAAFGFGRRICPGRHMSLEALFYMVACTLAMFDIVPPTDDKGRPAIKYEVTDGALSHPEDFECFLRHYETSPQGNLLGTSCGTCAGG